MTTWEFPCPDPAAITIDPWATGSVAVSGEATGVLAVEVVPSKPNANVDHVLEQVKVTFENGRLTVRGPKLSGLLQRMRGLDLTIRAPAGSGCQARTASADVALVGQLGDVIVRTASGDITSTAATGPATMETASGDVFVDRAASDMRIETVSGDVQVGDARGHLNLHAVSGDLTIGGVSGQVGARTISGDIALRDISGGQATLATTSGDVKVTVTPGIGVYLELASMSGHVHSDLDEQDTSGGDSPDTSLELRCRSISGDIRIFRARAAA
jgi:Putative adhesin